MIKVVLYGLIPSVSLRNLNELEGELQTSGMMKLVALRSNATVVLVEVVPCSAVAGRWSCEDAAGLAPGGWGVVVGAVLAMIVSRYGRSGVVSKTGRPKKIGTTEYKRMELK